MFDFITISTVTKIRRGMRSNMFDHDPDEPAAEAKPVRDRVSFGVGRDGRWRLNGNLNLDDGRRIEAALTERKDALFADGDENATWANALLDCCERSLDSIASRSRRDRYRTWIHLDTSGDATTTDGWRVPMALREHVLCDGVVQPVWEHDGVSFRSDDRNTSSPTGRGGSSRSVIVVAECRAATPIGSSRSITSSTG